MQTKGKIWASGWGDMSQGLTVGRRWVVGQAVYNGHDIYCKVFVSQGNVRIQGRPDAEMMAVAAIHGVNQGLLSRNHHYPVWLGDRLVGYLDPGTRRVWRA